MEMNSTLLITSVLTNQNAQKALFTCVVYSKDGYFHLITQHHYHDYITYIIIYYDWLAVDIKSYLT